MFTAALRFVPDFIAESKAVQEAQACRGLSTKGNVFKKVINYMSVVQPLMLKSLELIKDRSIVDAVEKEIGELK